MEYDPGNPKKTFLYVAIVVLLLSVIGIIVYIVNLEDEEDPAAAAAPAPAAAAAPAPAAAAAPAPSPEPGSEPGPEPAKEYDDFTPDSSICGDSDNEYVDASECGDITNGEKCGGEDGKGGRWVNSKSKEKAVLCKWKNNECVYHKDCGSTPAPAPSPEPDEGECEDKDYDYLNDSYIRCKDNKIGGEKVDDGYYTYEGNNKLKLYNGTEDTNEMQDHKLDLDCKCLELAEPYFCDTYVDKYGNEYYRGKKKDKQYKKAGYSFCSYPEGEKIEKGQLFETESESGGNSGVSGGSGGGDLMFPGPGGPDSFKNYEPYHNGNSRSSRKVPKPHDEHFVNFRSY